MKVGTSGRVAAGIVTAAACLALLAAPAAHADNDDAVAKARHAFVDRMVASHGFDRAQLAALLDGAAINQNILDAIAKPAERVLPWYEYRNIFLTDARIDAGVQFWTDHADAIERTAERYGVAPEMIVAIIGVETFFGRRTGSYRVIDALSTLAFAYPPRATFFASELENFLVLGRDEQLDVTKALGSYAGAMGAGQFMPSSYRSFAVDGDGDGKRDLLGDWDDVLASVANYFKKSGWQPGEPVADRATRTADFHGAEPGGGVELNTTVGALANEGYAFTTRVPTDAPAVVLAFEAPDGGSEYWIGYKNFRVITRYNRSPKYALAAHQLGDAIRERYLSVRQRSAVE
jgi:membrane-bound lytic murein transglycosylase B